MPKNEKARGFTLIEAIAVLVLIGIISAAVLSRSMGTSDYDLASQVEVVKNHLRHAQLRAMNTDTSWGIDFTSTTTYNLFQVVGTTATTVQLPGEDNATVNLITKKSALRITSAPQKITFDKYGSPLLGSATASATIPITTNGGNFNVTQNTGFIP